MNSDSFEIMQELLCNKKYGVILDKVYDKKNDQLRREFSFDSNHGWYVIGVAFFKLEKYKNSLEAFKKSIRTRKDDSQALEAIGKCYSEINRPKLAERYYRKALGFVDNKDRQAINYDLGNALFDQERYAEAIKQYTKVIKSKSTDLELRKLAKGNISVSNCNLGHILFDQKRYAEAIRQYTKVIKSQSANIEVREHAKENMEIAKKRI